MTSKGTGIVYLVGAGPGDPGLITVRGITCLERAEVIVYDRLAAPELLERANPRAERIYAGKGPGRHTLTQDQINDVLVRHARLGRTVVRLKGGDPYVYGRGGEEGLALRAAGVPFEVVPGVTSAVAGPSFAGIPVTHRGVASSFTVATGHEDPTKDGSSINWAALAHGADTLVFLMGVEHLDEIVDRLLQAGRPGDEPVAAVRRASTADQQVVIGTLATIVGQVKAADLRPPAVLVVGRVVTLANQLDWRAGRPLDGLRVLVTRARQQASQLSNRLYELGARAIEYPTIEIAPADDFGPLDRALAQLNEFGWVVFTSTNGVDAFFERLGALGRDARALGACEVCAIGPSTATRLRHHGILADWVPDQFITGALVDGFRRFDLAGVRILLARADIAPPALADGLRAQGALVTEVTAYRTVPAVASRDRLLEALEGGQVDVVTCTSSSTVRNLVAGLDGRLELLRDVTIACIGPVTARTARELGLPVHVVAETHTIDGLVDALIQWRLERQTRTEGSRVDRAQALAAVHDSGSGEDG